MTADSFNSTEEGKKEEIFFINKISKLGIWSIEDIMQARNIVLFDSHPLWNNYFNTNFGIVAAQQRIYLIPYSHQFFDVATQVRIATDFTKVKSHARSDLILGRDLTAEEARNSPLWLDFADGNQKQLDDYVENTFRFGKDKLGYEMMMGIHLPEEKEAVERTVGIGGLYSRSQAIYHDPSLQKKNEKENQPHLTTNLLATIKNLLTKQKE